MIAALRRLSAAGAVVVAAGVLSGCGCTSLIERDTLVSRNLERRLSEFSRIGPDGATRRVDELADFPWDRVYLFSGEVTSYREINAAVGDQVFEGCGEGLSFGHEDYMVFTRGGKAVHAVGVLSTLVDGDKQSYPRSAVIRAVSRDPAPYFLEFVDRRR